MESLLSKRKLGSLTFLFCKHLRIKKAAYPVVDIIAGSRWWFHIWGVKSENGFFKSHNITEKAGQLAHAMRHLVG